MRPLRPKPQRADASGQPLVRPAGLAGRPEPGRTHGAAAGGPGSGPLHAGAVRPGDAGSGVAGAGLGRRAGVPEPPDRRLSGRLCPAGGGRAALSLLLHPGGAAGRPHRSDGIPVYDGRCRRLPPEELARLAQSRRPSWRIQVPEEVRSFRDLLQGDVSQDLALDCGDFILRRSDGVYAYQLAVVVDDGAMGVTQVVRGSDLLDSTPRQLWLQERLGLPQPEYGHVPLLLAPDGRRLAKRDRDQELGALQSRWSARELVGQLALLAGLIPEYAPISPGELIPLFSWEKLPQADCTVPLL